MSTQRPSVIILLLDALRADCVPGAPSSPHLRSLSLARPNLPAFAELTDGAWQFTQAVSCSGYTTPCVGSIFTGLLPPEHGVRAFDLTALSRDVRTLAEILSANGYAACAMTDQPAVLQPMGLLRGFQTTVATEDEALAWWDSFAGVPRFLFLHIWDCHKPYGMPFGRRYRAGYSPFVSAWQERLRQNGIAEPGVTELLDEDEQRQRVYAMQFAWEGALGFRAGLQTYLDGLAAFDRGRLRDLVGAIRQRRMLDDAISVVLADHGEGRDRPPSWRMTHDMSLADDVMRIPLYIRCPQQGAVRPVVDQVSQVDVTPTLLDLLGLSGEQPALGSTRGPAAAVYSLLPQSLDCHAPGQATGRQTPARSVLSGCSLAPLLNGQSLPPRAAYAEVTRLNNAPLQRVGLTGVERVATLHARVLRYPDRKYRLAGHAGDLDAALLDQQPEVVVREACRRLLGRAERPEDVSLLLPIVNDAGLTAEDKAAAIQDRLSATDEWRLLDKYAVYDLQRDPLEVNPLDPRRRAACRLWQQPALERGSPGAAGWRAYQEQVAIMDTIDAAQRPGSPLFTNEADEQVILKRLQDLGYVE